MRTKSFLHVALLLLVALSAQSLHAQQAGSDATPVSGPSHAASAEPTKDALMTLEKSAYEAWKSKDAKFWGTFLSDNFVGYGSSGRLDKASATKQYAGTDCDVKSYALSDEQMRPLSHDVALITYKTTIDGTCAGQRVPASSWAASLFVRDGDTWKGAFHADAAIVDPKAATSARPVDVNETSQTNEANSTGDAGTDALLPIERNLWEAWRTHDGKKMSELTAGEISFINIFGTYFPTKATALRDWTGPGCDVKSVSVTNPATTMLSPTVGILTFTGTADGTCYGQKVNSVIWGTSVYVKHDDVWKWSFGINVPAGRGGA